MDAVIGWLETHFYVIGVTGFVALLAIMPVVLRAALVYPDATIERRPRLHRDVPDWRWRYRVTRAIRSTSPRLQGFLLGFCFAVIAYALEINPRLSVALLFLFVAGGLVGLIAGLAVKVRSS